MKKKNVFFLIFFYIIIHFQEKLTSAFIISDPESACGLAALCPKKSNKTQSFVCDACFCLFFFPKTKKENNVNLKMKIFIIKKLFVI